MEAEDPWDVPRSGAGIYCEVSPPLLRRLQTVFMYVMNVMVKLIGSDGCAAAAE